MTNKTKELVAAGHALAKELHCPESAALVRELATQLDVLRARTDALLDELEAAGKRNAELEAREVDLPDLEKWRSVDSVRAQAGYRVLVIKALAAAGITVKGDSE